MSTTAVFSEILAIGIQTTVLVGMAFAALVDVGPAVSGAQGWEAALTVVLLASAYVLGVVADRIADSLLKPLRNAVSEHDPAEHTAMRRRVLEKESPLSTFLEYQRSRMRLMRGTILNLTLAIPVTTLYLLLRGPQEPLQAIAVSVIALVALVAACVFAFSEIVKAQDKWLHLIANPGALQPSPEAEV